MIVNRKVIVVNLLFCFIKSGIYTRLLLNNYSQTCEKNQKLPITYLRTILLLLLTSLSLLALTKTELSNSSSISLLIESSGSKPHEAFGHSSIRVKDSLLNLDITFGFVTIGTSDLKVYKDLLLGTTFYQWDVANFSQVKENAKKSKTTIHEYIFNLGLEEKQLVFDTLYYLYRHKRYSPYQYHLLNCTTHLRNILTNVKGVKATRNSGCEHRTSREILQDDLKNNFIFRVLLADIGLGIHSDTTLSCYEQV
ncbi:MAG: DUF4105 domain-containing protein [Cyclobacteriaceae bacterium]